PWRRGRLMRRGVVLWQRGARYRPKLALAAWLYTREGARMAQLHDYVELEYNGRTVPIDVALVPLIDVLWKRGIQPTGSGEDWNADVFDLPQGTAAIAFVHAADARRFANACKECASDRSVVIAEPDEEDLALGAEHGTEPWEA